ncbi:hypothetical protein VTJ49DRAFT_7026 [Mycothermus thermophilus]|uniref:Major facilitator superfamily (MFS) profile domain-containing protein n=1 Tax=Humicola insolens TaxID=85995 RepID=A0ABR3VKP0_HUMIN
MGGNLQEQTTSTERTQVDAKHSDGEFELLDTLVNCVRTRSVTNAPAPFAHISRKRRKAILRKMDLHLIPVLTLLYLLSFLDRGNIGNAQIEGLSSSLHLTDAQYNWCLTVFFFTYAGFEVPSNLMLKRLRPSVWIPSIMVAWGVVVTLMGFVKSFRGLLAARIFLGVTEAGLFPGVAYYLTNWYRREEMQLRQAMFFSAAGIAGAFSGLLAFAIGKMDGVGGLEGWRWIFILEGIATVVIAGGAFWAMYDYPETAGFLTEEEREWVVWRLKYQHNRPRTQVEQEEGFRWRYVRDAFCDWQVWLSVVLYWGIACPLYGISLFLPTIIQQLGYRSSTAQLMTVPFYTSAAVFALVAAYLCDHAGRRSPFILSCLFIMAAGFSAMASNFYRGRDAPWFRLGHSLELGFIAAGMVATICLLVGYVSQNRMRVRMITEGALDEYTAQELSEKGDRAVTFRYMY